MPPLSPNLTDSMAITEVPEYAHLSDDDVENLAAALDTIRCDVEGSRGTKDRDYIRRAIAFQRCLEVAARLTLIGSRSKAGWALGTAALAAAKCIENMELSHNISHGQWDWMNDPEIHSSTWEWDMVGPSKHWQSSHNHLHHMFTNVVGMENVVANGLRNVWAYAVIVCGHFADGAEKFTPSVLENETKPEWYLRQMLGTANFRAGPALAFMSGNLCYQIEHHLFPDLPSNRYPEIAQRVRALCVRYDLPYTTGPLLRQYLLTVRTICKLALPDRFLSATADDAPETASEIRFRDAAGRPHVAIADTDVRRRGLATAMLTRSRRGQPGGRTA